MSDVSYFYADHPDIYDRSVALVDRSYEMGHDALESCVVAWIRAKGDRGLDQVNILDLGCGTGKEALRLIARQSAFRVIAVDNSDEMLSAFRNKISAMFSDESLSGRIVFQKANFCDKHWFNCDALAGNIGASRPSIDVTIAAHSLHHLTMSQKRRLYGEVSALMRPGGLFAILDLFDYDQPWISTLARENLATWLTSQMAHDSLAADHAGLFPVSRRLELVKLWLDHIDKENRPLPIDVSIADGVSEISLLRDSGFENMQRPFRWFQSGLILAEKAH
ncbi:MULTISPECIES: class I SAM-dependent methyltransferase [unclassified Bradyrhizobium]|uniref:class I SAM-dependent methyltransferase n=1 Tax=unclassified Bradyrhizobium TaxID=2631580 RepID=UPI002916500B|nr:MULTISPECIES: class I SAM-dependent methyltransferase [unclassified Bradyrhizobium]